MSSRKNAKAKREDLERQREAVHTFKGPESYKPGTTMRAFLEQLAEKEGLLRVNYKASYDGKGINLSDLISCLHILTDPTHKENRWSCLVEMVKYDDDIYLRLVPSIPLEVKAKWEATGKPPRQMVSNDVGLILETLKQALPSKPATKSPPARKARKAPRKPSAKKPEPAIEETPEQKKKAAGLRMLDLMVKISKSGKGRQE